MNKKEKTLLRMLAEHSYQKTSNKIRLASGKFSSEYIDCKKTLSMGENLSVVGDVFFSKLIEMQVDKGESPVAIGGMGAGALSIAISTAFVADLEGCPLSWFDVRKEPKSHGLKQSIDGNVTSGQHVMVVEDVITTGKSVIESVDKARWYGLNVTGVIALVDRQEGGLEMARKILEIPIEAIFTKEDIVNVN